MDKKELRARITSIYEDELQYAIHRDDEVDLVRCRTKAASRIGREMEGQDISAVWLGYIEGIARNVESGFEEDLSTGQLRIEGGCRVRDLTIVPSPKMRRLDWIALDRRHEEKMAEHVAKRSRERDVISGIVDRLEAFGGDPTTIEACPDLFAKTDEAAA